MNNVLLNINFINYLREYIAYYNPAIALTINYFVSSITCMHAVNVPNISY